jgi:hypothetical protein
MANGIYHALIAINDERSSGEEPAGYLEVVSDFRLITVMAKERGGERRDHSPSAHQFLLLGSEEVALEQLTQ